jgi:hypothetical protein
VAASDFDEFPTLKLVLEQLALGLGAFQDRVGAAERVSKRRISENVKAGKGIW